MAGLDNRRRWNRYSLYAPVEYNYDYNKPRQTARALNMSEGGALIPLQGFIGPGAKLTLKIFFKSGYSMLRSRVAHIGRQARGNMYYAGLEFLDRPHDFLINFRKELSDLELYKIRCSKESGREVPLSEASSRWYEKASSML